MGHVRCTCDTRVWSVAGAHRTRFAHVMSRHADVRGGPVTCMAQEKQDGCWPPVIAYYPFATSEATAHAARSPTTPYVTAGFE